MIKSLPKSFEMKHGQLPYYYDDTWITNGCFAIKLNHLKDSHLYCLTKPNVIQPEINRIIPSKPGSIRAVKTDRLYEMKTNGYARVFIDQNDNEYLVNEMYVKQFSLDILYTHGEFEVMADEDINIIVMPMRHTQRGKKLKAA